MKFICEYITWIHGDEGRWGLGEDDKVCVCWDRESERERRHRWNDFSGITVWLVEQRGGNCILITVLMVLCSARWKLLYRYAQNKSAFCSNPPLAPFWHYSVSIYCLASLHVSPFTSRTYLSSFLQQCLLNYSFFFLLLCFISSIFSIFFLRVSLSFSFCFASSTLSRNSPETHSLQGQRRTLQTTVALMHSAVFTRQCLCIHLAQITKGNACYFYFELHLPFGHICRHNE